MRYVPMLLAVKRSFVEFSGQLRRQLATLEIQRSSAENSTEDLLTRRAYGGVNSFILNDRRLNSTYAKKLCSIGGLTSVGQILPPCCRTPVGVQITASNSRTMDHLSVLPLEHIFL